MLAGVGAADDVGLAALGGRGEGGAHALGPLVGLRDVELLEVQADAANVVITLADLK